MQNLFFKDSKINTHNYQVDNQWSFYKDASPEHLVKTFNNIFLDYWECTPYKEIYKIPTILLSINDDKTANFSYIDGNINDLKSVKGCSCWYTVDHQGLAHVKEFNEILDLKNLIHMHIIAATIIKDVFGPFDMKKAGEIFVKKLTHGIKKDT